MTIEAMKQALDALESCTPADTSTGHVVWPSYDEQAVAQAITALRTAIAEAEKQEPAITVTIDEFGLVEDWYESRLSQGVHTLYTTPPQRQPLTDDEIWKFWWSRPAVDDGDMESQFVAAVRAVLAAHGITGEKPDAA